MATALYCVLLFLLPSYLTVSFADDDDVLISTKNGKVQGKVLSVLGGEVRAFLGIPYAKPPLGKLRFRAPEPADSWEGVKNVTSFPNACIQIGDTSLPDAYIWAEHVPKKEDCLYLNIWTPRFEKDQNTSPVPVMFFIHGGGFVAGTSSVDIYDGRYLTKTEDVIVVSINYRVGAFGFLSLPDNDNIRGNAGLLDQRLAMQWVADNIAAFGGDPSQVTLFGESAGSASVGFHVLSPGSKGLFQRAVMQSGVPYAKWASIDLTEAWSRGQKLGTLLGCSMSDPVALEACMQQADASLVMMMQFAVLSDLGIMTFPFAPVIDGVFLPDNLEALMNNNSIPQKEIMVGVNHDEGPTFLVGTVPGMERKGQSLITRKQFLYGVDLLMKNEDYCMKQMAIKMYTDWTDVNNGEKNRDALTRMTTDQLFICPVQRLASSYARAGGKPFLYFFAHRSSLNPWPKWMGTMHTYELEFVFGRPLNPSMGYPKEEVDLSRKMMNYWANFARTGNPGTDGHQWPVFTPEHKEYVTLTTQPLEMKEMLKSDQCHFWNDFISKMLRAGVQQP